jgi:hypothetical protein
MTAVCVMVQMGYADAAEASVQKRFGVLAFLDWDHAWNGHMYPDRASIERAAAKMRELGITDVRVDFPWVHMEKDPGVWTFERYDDIADVMYQNGISVCAVLGYSPQWMGAWNDAPRDLAAYENYVRTVVARYKDRITAWECWNEPDSPVYFVPQDGMKTYAEVLRVCSRAVRETDPSATVLVGGMTTDGYFKLKELFKLGLGDAFDVINYHPFVNPENPSATNEAVQKMRLLRELMVKHGKPPRIWVTEIGCPGVPRKGEARWWEGIAQDEDEQAAFLETIVTALTMQQGVEKVFWAFWQDTDGHFRDAVDHFGLLRHDGSSKPAYERYRAIISKDMQGT